MMQNYSYNNIWPPSSYASYDIQVPVNEPQYWFWIEKSGSMVSGSPYILRHGNNPASASVSNPTPWVSFPTANINYIPIGYVDTLSSASVFQAYTRQILTSDVVSVGGAASTWTVYDESASYSPGDQVKVDQDIQYSQSFGLAPLLSPGLFVNIIKVPPALSGSRNSYNYYNPMYPTIPTSSVVTVSGSQANLNFWLPLSPMTLLNQCNGNTTQQIWVNSTISGSVFNLANLPYIP
jgi:hypothetical protein